MRVPIFRVSWVCVVGGVGIYSKCSQRQATTAVGRLRADSIAGLYNTTQVAIKKTACKIPVRWVVRKAQRLVQSLNVSRQVQTDGLGLNCDEPALYIAECQNQMRSRRQSGIGAKAYAAKYCRAFRNKSENYWQQVQAIGAGE